MKRLLSWLPVLIAAAVTLTGCAGSASNASTQGTTQSAPAAAKVLTIGTLGEPVTFEGFNGVGGSRGGGGITTDLIHSHLTAIDPFDQAVPQLATEIPSIENGTWKVNADGSMDMTWKLHSGVVWHDGAPFTSDDLMFGLALHKDPEMAHAYAATARLMESAITPDPVTFVVHWSKVDTTALQVKALTPFPRHLMEDAYQADKQAFVNSSRFTTEFVGLGPYRLVKWERGSFLQVDRFDAYYQGHAPLDRIMVKFIGDPNAVMANILAGAIQVALPTNFDADQALDLKRHWEGTGNVVRVEPIPRITYHELMLRPEYAKPANGLPVLAVRQALYQAIDRQGITDVITGGLGPIADSWISPADPMRKDLEASISKFPYDPTKALQTLAQAGWTKGPDGILTHTAGEKMEIEIWTNPQTSDKAGTITVDNWKAIGVVGSFKVLSAAQGEDREYQSGHPGLLLTGSFIDQLLDRYDSRDMPSAANRWSGRDRAGYANQRFDQLLDLGKGTVDPKDRLAIMKEQLQIATSEVAMFPLFWEPRAALILKGVKQNIHPYNSGWNTFQWDLEA